MQKVQRKRRLKPITKKPELPKTALKKSEAKKLKKGMTVEKMLGGFKPGWNRSTTTRDGAVEFLNRLASHPRALMLHQHVVPMGGSEYVDIYFFIGEVYLAKKG